MRIETATLGGGCFWCLECVYNDTRGVLSASSGYMGGTSLHPTYQQVCSGTTGHVEVVQLTFDSDQITFREILEIFFVIHDPTTPNRQGEDVGTQYRSVIFFHSEEQEAVARAIIAEVTSARAFDDPIVTAVEPAGTWWRGEEYHQNYLANNPSQPFCMYVVRPKLDKFRQRFAERRKGVSEVGTS